MEDTLITFEIAKLAKEKGFNEMVPQGYDSEDLEYERFGLPKGVQFGICTNHLPNSYTAPTQSLLQKWLREKYYLHIIINSYVKSNKQVQWDIDIRSIKANKLLFEHTGYSSYEEALEIGLQEALKLNK